MAEAVVVTVFVVISHVNLVLALGTRGVNGTRLAYVDSVFSDLNWFTLCVACGSAELTRFGTLVVPVRNWTVVCCKWGSPFTELLFSYVDTAVEVDLSSWSVTSRVLAVVNTVLYVNLSCSIALVGLTVALFAIEFDAGFCTLGWCWSLPVAVVLVDVNVLFLGNVCTRASTSSAS